MRSYYLPAPRGLSPKQRRRGAPPSPGSRAPLDGSASRRKHHRRQSRVPRWPAAKQTARNGSGVPGPSNLPPRLGVRDGQKHLPDRLHTPAATQRASAKRAEGKGQEYRGNKWRKGIEPGEDKLLRSQIAVSTADAGGGAARRALHGGVWLSGIRISTAAFRQRIPKGDGLLCALSGHRTSSYPLAALRPISDGR